jgi:hypothetical protein
LIARINIKSLELNHTNRLQAYFIFARPIIPSEKVPPMGLPSAPARGVMDEVDSQ